MSARKASRLVYLDTTPAYALLDKHDARHADATAGLRELARQGAQLETPLPIALELYKLVLFRKPADPARAQQLVRATLASAPLAHPASEHVERALATLAKYPDQAVTLEDAIVAEMAKDARARVFTFDLRDHGLLGSKIAP